MPRTARDIDKEAMVLLVMDMIGLLDALQEAAPQPKWFGKGTPEVGRPFTTLMSPVCHFGLSRHGHRFDRKFTAHRSQEAHA